jgi:ABC-type spermidine/putrescine transport system permease subunit II
MRHLSALTTRYSSSPLYRAHLLAGVITAVTLVFVLTPMVVLVIFSFNTSPFYQFPLEGLSLRWYSDFLSNSLFIDAFWQSVYIALFAAVISTALATLFAYALARYRPAGERLLAFIGIAPLFIPNLILGIALQMLIIRTNIIGLGHIATILGHVVFATPFAALIIWSWLVQVDWRLEDVSRDLGATRFKSLLHVTAPLAWIGVRSGLILSFLLSFNDLNIALFLANGFNTLPVAVASSSHFGLRPGLLAYATMVMFAVLALLVVLVPLLAPLMKRLRPR